MTTDAAALRCLSIRQPHAFLICCGLKRVENRTWQARHRGPLLVHAGKATEDAGDLRAAVAALAGRYRMSEASARSVYRDWAAKGAIVGKAVMHGCITKAAGTGALGGVAGSDPATCFTGPVGFLLRDAAFLWPPVPCRGRLSFFRLPPSLRHPVRAADVIVPGVWERRALGLSADANSRMDAAAGRAGSVAD